MAIITPPAPPPLVVPDMSGDLDKWIGKYIKLRDMSEAMKKRHTAERRPLLDALELLENGFLKVLNDSKIDSSTAKGAGTIYKTTKRRASIEDGALFRRHVIGAEQFELVDWRANANEVRKSMDANDQPVPGVKYSEDVEVNVRRA